MPKKNEIPESQNQQESLISSNSIPSIEGVEAEFDELIRLTKEARNEPKKTREKKNKSKMGTVSTESNSEPIEPEIIEAQFTPEDVEEMVCFPLDAFFIRQNKKRLNTVERKSFAISCSRVMNKWLPSVSSKWKEEAALAICLGTIFFSRMEHNATDIESSSK